MHALALWPLHPPRLPNAFATEVLVALALWTYHKLWCTSGVRPRSTRREKSEMNRISRLPGHSNRVKISEIPRYAPLRPEGGLRAGLSSDSCIIFTLFFTTNKHVYASITQYLLAAFPLQFETTISIIYMHLLFSKIRYNFFIKFMNN